MADDIRLTLACGDYDRTRPLWDGSVHPEGITLDCVVREPNEIFRRMLKDEEFDVSEMSLSNYIMECGKSPRRFVAIPVFLSRAFRHSNIYIHKPSGIREARDLRGKRIGVSEYHTTLALWLRGILWEEYQVSPEEVEWFTGGVEGPGPDDRMGDFAPPPGVKIHRIPPGKCLSGMLEDGEIDVLLNPRKPGCFDGRKITRLWENYREMETDYYARTKIFPIMHVVVIRRDVALKYPWAAEPLQRLRPGEENRAGEIDRDGYPAGDCLGIFEAEKAMELMGRDYWPYGVEANRHVLETMLRYAKEQGLCLPRITVDNLFPATIAE
ncbi:MAG: ABC transporter substrate-binding protein [Anaerotruncus massiliensis (ex Togo et al. 2019)]